MSRIGMLKILSLYLSADSQKTQNSIFFGGGGFLAVVLQKMGILWGILERKWVAYFCNTIVVLCIF